MPRSREKIEKKKENGGGVTIPCRAYWKPVSYYY